MVGKKPNYVLQVKPKDASMGRTTVVGVGWKDVSPAGVECINIRLNPGAVLSWKDELWITLWAKPDEEGHTERPRYNPPDSSF